MAQLIKQSLEADRLHESEHVEDDIETDESDETPVSTTRRFSEEEQKIRVGFFSTIQKILQVILQLLVVFEAEWFSDMKLIVSS